MNPAAMLLAAPDPDWGVQQVPATPGAGVHQIAPSPPQRPPLFAWYAAACLPACQAPVQPSHQQMLGATAHSATPTSQAAFQQRKL